MPPALSRDRFEALLPGASITPWSWVAAGGIWGGFLPPAGASGPRRMPTALGAEGSTINISRQLCFQEINRPAIFIRRGGLSLRAGL